MDLTRLGSILCSFQSQSNGSDKSIIQLYKSANMKMNFNIMTF